MLKTENPDGGGANRQSFLTPGPFGLQPVVNWPVYKNRIDTSWLAWSKKLSTSHQVKSDWAKTTGACSGCE